MCIFKQPFLFFFQSSQDLESSQFSERGESQTSMDQSPSQAGHSQSSVFSSASSTPATQTPTASPLSAGIIFVFMQLLFSFDQDMRVKKTLIQTIACQVSSALIQLLFSFDQDMRVKKTLIQTIACQI